MNGSRHIYSAYGMLIVLNALVKPVWIFGIDRAVQNHTGPGAYGSYFAVLNLSIVFSFLLDWGFTTYHNRRLAADPQGFGVNTGKLVWVKLLFALAYVMVTAVTALLSGMSDWNLLGSVMLTQILTSFFLFFRGILTARHWFMTDAWASVLDKSLVILLCALWLLPPGTGSSLTVQQYAWLQAGGSLVSVILLCAILYQKGVRIALGQFRLPDRSIWKGALPFAGIVLLMSAHARLDGFLLERWCGSREAGTYAAAFRILDAGNMLGYLGASFLLPIVANHWERLRSIPALVLHARHFLMLSSIGLSVTAVYYANELHDLLYTERGPRAIETWRLCLPALTGYALTHVYGTVLTATGATRPFLYINAAALILNAALNSWFIPVYGATGASGSALISQSACGIACLTAAVKYCGATLHLRSLLLYIFSGALLIGLYEGAEMLHLPAAYAMGGTAVILVALSAIGMLRIARRTDLSSE
ncbi:MAG: hypothetical protein RJA57_443 [Bacteroidota bacterium]|jgi:O-antigen/teichoic acid export membrane protein